MLAMALCIYGDFHLSQVGNSCLQLRSYLVCNKHLFASDNTLPLQRILGHTNLTMTKRYVTLTQDDLKEQHAHASPVNKLVPERKRVKLRIR